MRYLISAFGWILLLTFAGAGEVKLIQKTPPELADFGIDFQRLVFTFPEPVSARFWIEYDSGHGQPERIDVPYDRVLPTSLYALSYVQLADGQVAVSVTTDETRSEGRRTGVIGGHDGSGTRSVVYQPTSSEIKLDQDVELFVTTIKPPSRRPKDPTHVYKVMAHFSEAEFPVEPIPTQGNAYWKLSTEGRLAVERQTPKSFGWKDVSPPSLAAVAKAQPDSFFWADVVALSAISAQEAWIAVATPLPNHPTVWLEHTRDGGKNWREIATPVATEAVCLSFVNAQHGYLLALGSPAAGLMKKAVYGTADGGAHWQLLAAPEGAFYPTGICFRTAQEGWITGTYHGAPDAPLFHTQDGGKSWQLQTLEIPENLRGGYADLYPPYFYPFYPDLHQGQLPVKLVRHEPKPEQIKWLYYYTEDGGQTWHLP